MNSVAGDVTRLLRQWSDGDNSARDRAIELVYDDLKRIASARLAGFQSNQTIQPTALVHEAFLKLDRAEKVQSSDRVHFIALSARIMRQLLVDHMRYRNAARRASDQSVTLHTGFGSQDEDFVDLLALDDALERLAERQPEQAEIVEMRYFGGLSIEETASAMGQSVSTVNRNWRAARAWLFLQLKAQS